ncbi:MAG: hypothetical protein ACP5HM_16475 [Anaerolineae bacterium]
MQPYRDHFSDLGRQSSTVNRKLAALCVFFAWVSTTLNKNAGCPRR